MGKQELKVRCLVKIAKYVEMEKHNLLQHIKINTSKK